MHLSKVSLVNYRNFSNATFHFDKGINTIIGENGSGKSNFFRAIRLLLDDSMRRSALKLEEKDFFRGLGDWRGHWIIISLEFDEVSQDEIAQAIFLHGVGNIAGERVTKATYNLIFRPNANVRTRLSQIPPGNHFMMMTALNDINISDYETVLTGRSLCDFNDPTFYTEIAGDFKNAIFPTNINHPLIGARISTLYSISNEVCFTFVKALRDVVLEFQNNRTNPLFSLLTSKSGSINDAEFHPIISQVNFLNGAIENLSDVKIVREDIHRTINDAVGDAYCPTSLSIKSGLSSEPEELFQSLKLFISESDDREEGGIHEMSLGGANLIYLTLKLLEFKYQQKKQSIANFLLIEEPEAHIHTHIQKTLFDKIDYPNTQVIYSTHSTQISEVGNIKNMNILGKLNGTYTAFQPANNLLPEQVNKVQRYLDAVRCNLLFARSVALVEGDAEEILIPILFKCVFGITLDELGISLINIRSTGFENVALLFHDHRIKKRCSIVTDLDAAFIDTTPHLLDTEEISKEKKKAQASAESGANRAISLDSLCLNNIWLRTFYARHTFEVDLVLSGNFDVFNKAVTDVYKDATTIKNANDEFTSQNPYTCAKRALTMANHTGKGWFALILGKSIDHNTNLPQYITDALLFAHGKLSLQTFIKVINYRLLKMSDELNSQRAMVAFSQGQPPNWHADWQSYISQRDNNIQSLRYILSEFQNEKVAFSELTRLIGHHFPNDPMNVLSGHV